MQDVKTAEQERGQHADVRAPHREDDERDGKPAAVAEGVGRPDALGVVHDVVQSAETGDHRARAGGDVFIARHIHAGGVGRIRALAHGAQVQTRTRALEDEGGHQRDDHREIGQKAVA